MTQGGKVKVTFGERRLQSFLYLLLRDYLPSGDVEELFETLGDSEHYPFDIVYSCPYIAGLSGDMAQRLLGSESGMSDNEEGQHEDRKETHKESSRPKEGDVGVTVATGEGYPKSNEDDARVREAEEDDREDEGYDKDGYDPEGFNRDNYDREGYDVEGYDREGVLKVEREDGGYLDSSGFAITEEEIIDRCLEGEGKGKATCIEDDDLGINSLEEGDRSDSTGSTASKSEDEAEGKTQS